MKLKDPKKTVKVLYLYLTVPLLIVALVMGVLAWGMLSSEKKEESAPAMVDDAKPDEDKGIEWGAKEECLDGDGCRVGERCVDGRCINPLREHTRRSSEVKAADDDMSGTGWAAVIAAIMGGLTGLLAAVTQTIVAFMEMRERRRLR